MGMNFEITTDFKSVATVVKEFGLSDSGDGQRFFVSEFARHMDPYIPMDTRMLKNNKTLGNDFIRYNSPYAQRQYHENKGKGLRGKEWDQRCWDDKGEQITVSVAKFIRARGGG